MPQIPRPWTFTVALCRTTHARCLQGQRPARRRPSTMSTERSWMPSSPMPGSPMSNSRGPSGWRSRPASVASGHCWRGASCVASPLGWTAGNSATPSKRWSPCAWPAPTVAGSTSSASMCRGYLACWRHTTSAAPTTSSSISSRSHQTPCAAWSLTTCQGILASSTSRRRSSSARTRDGTASRAGSGRDELTVPGRPAVTPAGWAASAPRGCRQSCRAGTGDADPTAARPRRRSQQRPSPCR